MVGRSRCERTGAGVCRSTFHPSVATDATTQAARCVRVNELCTCVQVVASSMFVTRRWAELEDECSALLECKAGGDDEINDRMTKVGGRRTNSAHTIAGNR